MPPPTPQFQLLFGPLDLANRCLKGLTEDAQRLLQPHVSRRHVAAGERMQEAGLPIQHLIFPASGAYSVQTAKGVEVAVVGRTGLLGLDLVLRDPLARFAAVALVDGEVDQIDANAFSHLVRARSGLGPQLLPHVSSFLGQVATTAALAARSTIQQRVAAWVLAVTALTDSDELRITHRQLAACLCVRRAGVTVALHVLEGLHALRSKRHVLTVTDRQALTDMAA